MEELGITIEFLGKTIEFDKSTDGMKKAILTLKKEVRLFNEEVKKDPSKYYENSIKKLHNLEQQLKIAKQRQQEFLNVLAETSQADKDEYNGALARVADATKEVNQIEAQIKKVNAEIEKSTDKTQQFADAMSNVSNVTGKLADAFQPISKASQDFLKSATDEAINFESAFTDVRKTVKSTGSEFMDNLMFSQLEEGAKELSTYLPNTASEIAKLMGLAGQMNVPADQIKDFTESMIMFGDSTNITADEAVTSIAQIYNVIGKGGDFSDLNNLLSAIVELGNNSATTEKDITTMFKNISAGASRVHMTEAQMVALSATLSSLGLDKGGASSISRILQNIDTAVSENSDKLQDWAKIVGMSGDAFSQAWSQDSAGVLLDVVKSMSQMTDEGISMNTILADLDISELRQVDTISRLANAHELYAQSLTLANNAYEEGSALSEEAQKRYETLASQMQVVKNNFTLFALSIGELVMPYVRKLTNTLKKVAKWLNDLSPEVKDMIMKGLAVIAVISPILSIISKITGAIASLTVGWIAFKLVLLPVLSNIGAFLTGIFSWFITLIGTHPITMAITAVVSALVILWNKSEAFRNLVNKLWEALKKLKDVLLSTEIEVFGISLGKLGDIFTRVTTPVATFVEWLGRAINKMSDFFGMSETISSSMSTAGRAIMGGGAVGGGTNVWQSGGIGLSMNIHIDNNGTPIDEAEVNRWADIMADRLDLALGRRL